MSLLVFSICWSRKDIGSNGSEGMDVLARLEQSFLLPFLTSVEGLAQIKGVPSRLKVQIKGLCLPTQRSGFPHFKPSKKSLTSVPSISGLKLATKNSHHTPFCLLSSLLLKLIPEAVRRSKLRTKRRRGTGGWAGMSQLPLVCNSLLYLPLEGRWFTVLSIINTS